MSNQETVHLARTLEETIKQLESILNLSGKDLKKGLADFFQYLNRPEVKKYLFVHGQEEQSTETFGIYKFYPNAGKHVESNYCKIAVPGIHVNSSGLKNPVQLPLSFLSSNQIKILSSNLFPSDELETVQEKVNTTEAIDTSDATEIIVKKEDLAKAIKELHDHFKQTLEFL